MRCFAFTAGFGCLFSRIGGLFLRKRSFLSVFDPGRCCSLYGILCDHTGDNGVVGRNVVHDIHHRFLHDGPQSAGAGTAPDCFFRDCFYSVILIFQCNPVIGEEFLVLL